MLMLASTQSSSSSLDGRVTSPWRPRGDRVTTAFHEATVDTESGLPQQTEQPRAFLHPTRWLFTCFIPTVCEFYPNITKIIFWHRETPADMDRFDLFYLLFEK